MKKTKETVLPNETEVDVVMFKQTDYEDALRLKRAGESKGWIVKIGQKNYLKQGNKI
jgi:hypothetical protein